MRDYGKVFSRIWESTDFRALTEDGRTLALYLLTCQHGTIAGVFRVPDGYASEDLQWDVERVAEGFRNLFDKGFATRCESTKWVWLHKFLEWNPPENPNQKKSAAKVAIGIPDGCEWKPAFMRASGAFLGIEAPQEQASNTTLAEPLDNPSLISSSNSSSSNTSPDGDGGKSADADVPDNCPQQKIIEAYHRLLPMGRQVREWTPARGGNLRTRWREKPARQKLEWWERFFAYCAASDFLTGRTSSPGRKPFEISLDWLVKAENMAKVIEGAYENEKAVA